MNVEVKANPGFKEVDRSKKRYIVMKGSAGSGKSVDTAQNYILRLMQDKGRNLVALRKSDITNRDSTFAELTGSLYKIFGDKADNYWKINKSPLSLTCKSNGNTPFQKAYNNSIRIARTEGHRIQVQSALDAQHVAKSKGADIVKQWDSTLDGNTRDLHRLLDGQIREIDEPFEVGGRKVEAPGMFGDPAEDCNCRCCLLQRARWALDDDELQTLKDRAAYFDLDKTKEFEEYQEKYLGITQEDIDNIKNSVKIKKIELPSETDNIKGMSNETKQAICDAFDKIKEEYNVRINNIDLESLGSGNEKVPFQYVPENVGGFLKYKLVLNKDYDFNGSLEAFSARIMRNHNNNVLAAQNVEDLIAHEMAHVLTFQNCDTYGLFLQMEEKVREQFIRGVSLYADSTYDGAETIAEAFVKYRHGEELPTNIMKLLEKYVLKKVK